MKERAGDRLLPIGLSILIHAAIVGALIWGAVWYRRPRPAPSTLAIEATVVSSAPAAAPSPAPPSPPAPDAEAAQRAEQEEAQRKHQQELEQQQAQERAQQQEKERAAAAEAAAQAEREAAEQAAAEQAAAAKIAAEKAAAQQAREEAERRAKAQEAAKAAAAAKAAQERAQSEADLRAQMAAEEHLNAEQANGAMAQYQALIAARIERVWIKPPTAHAGIRCAVQITQVPGGEITGVHVGACNGDDAVRQSIEAAAYRASPLPPPSDPALFDRDVVVTFTPHD